MIVIPTLAKMYSLSTSMPACILSASEEWDKDTAAAYMHVHIV